MCAESQPIATHAREHFSFAALARGGRNVFDPPSLHAMIFTYLDDSADKRREKYFAAGGLIGGEDQWATFDIRWLDETRELKEPFRSTDCETQHGQFENWPKPKCDGLMKALVGLIRWYHLSAFASIVPIADYRAVFPDAAEFDPYYLAVTHTIVNMGTIGERAQQSVKLWFERGPTSGRTLEIYQDLCNVRTWSAAWRLSNINFGSKQLCPLQAADLVAREAFKHMDNLGVRPTRIPTERMKDMLIYIVWNKETLTYLRDHGGPGNLDLLTSWGNKKWPQVPQMTVFYRNFDGTSRNLSL